MNRPMIRSTSSCDSTTQRTSPLRTRVPAAPPTYTSHRPPSMATAPRSFVVAAKHGSGGAAAVDPAYDAEGSVLLHSRVHALVDQSRVAFVVVFLAPDRAQQRGESRLAGRILATFRELGKDGRDAAQLVRPERVHQLWLGEWHSGHGAGH